MFVLLELGSTVVAISTRAVEKCGARNASNGRALAPSRVQISCAAAADRQQPLANGSAICHPKAPVCRSRKAKVRHMFAVGHVQRHRQLQTGLRETRTEL